MSSQPGKAIGSRRKASCCWRPIEAAVEAALVRAAPGAATECPNELSVRIREGQSTFDEPERDRKPIPSRWGAERAYHIYGSLRHKNHLDMGEHTHAIPQTHDVWLGEFCDSSHGQIPESYQSSRV